MTIKELFKLLAKSNELADAFGEEGERLIFCFDDYTTEEFTSYIEFKKYLKAEYISAYINTLLEVEFEFVKSGYGSGHYVALFDVTYVYGGQSYNKKVEIYKGE